jgi:extracellular solute-binding protein (family 5)
VPLNPGPPASPPSTAIRSDVGLDDCVLTPPSGEPIATVALADRIDPSNAPRPSNESERLLFRQLYETLIRIDCQGRVAPGLASSWRLDADGRTWIVTLRRDALFSDGTPLTSADVRASWAEGATGRELRQDVSRLVQSIVPIDDRSLSITLHSRRVDVPYALAHPDLAVAKFVPDSRWPLGTRTSRIAPDGPAPPAAAASALTLTRDNLPPVRFVVASGDARDPLDQGVDLLLTRDPMALDYAATLPQFQSVPLAWQRLHVLLTPGRSRSTPSLSEDARQVLARDAVRGEARGARGPFWWEVPTDCAVPPSPRRNQFSSAPRIVYDASDRAARELAERFVGLARGSDPAAAAFLDALLPDRPRRTYERATGLTGEALSQARRLGSDAGYVMALDSRPVDPCRDLQTLVDGARWLDPRTIVPLVETRMHAIVRRGRSGVTADWDGGLVVTGPNSPR